jgi:hypothetical protein
MVAMASPSIQKNTLDRSVIHCPQFPKALLKWIVMTMQPLSTCTNDYFRNMCTSLNGRAPDIGVEGLKALLVNEVAQAEVSLTNLLRNEHFSITSDSWTSTANDSYTGVTVHWISKDWRMKSCPLGCGLKLGTATADDHVSDVESILSKFSLTYSTKFIVFKNRFILAPNPDRIGPSSGF